MAATHGETSGQGAKRKGMEKQYIYWRKKMIGMQRTWMKMIGMLGMKERKWLALQRTRIKMIGMLGIRKKMIGILRTRMKMIGMLGISKEVNDILEITMDMIESYCKIIIIFTSGILLRRLLSEWVFWNLH